METRTQDLLFGTGRTSLGEGMRRPDEPVKVRDLLGTMRGREHVEHVVRSQLPSHRSAAQEAADLLGPGGHARNLMAGTSAPGAVAAGAGQVEYANPIYHGLYAQSLIQNHGFSPPTTMPGAPVATAAAPIADPVVEPAVRTVAAEATPAASPISAAADEVAANIANHEQRMMTALQGLGELPADRQVAALGAAVDATAQHGGDTYAVLARTIVERPLEDAAPALERALEDVKQGVAPIADDAAKVADDAAKVADDAAKVADDAVRVAAPVVEHATSVAKAAVASAPRAAFVPPAGLMSFRAGIDDTLRMLGRI